MRFNDLDTNALRDLLSGPRAKDVYDRLKENAEVSVNELETKTKIPRREIVTILKQMHHAGVGTYILGRQDGYVSRFALSVPKDRIAPILETYQPKKGLYLVTREKTAEKASEKPKVKRKNMKGRPIANKPETKPAEPVIPQIQDKRPGASANLVETPKPSSPRLYHTFTVNEDTRINLPKDLSIDDAQALIYLIEAMYLPHEPRRAN